MYRIYIANVQANSYEETIIINLYLSTMKAAALSLRSHDAIIVC